MDILELVNLYNSGMSLKVIGDRIGKSKSTVQRMFVRAGYVFYNGMYVSRETIDKGVDVSRETIDKGVDVSRETIDTIDMVNRTYLIPVDIDRAIKIKAAIEGKNATEIIRESLRFFIEQKYFDM